MADTSTTHLELIKQDSAAMPDNDKTNNNWDTLDSEIWNRGKTFNGETVGEDGGFHVRSVPYAENLDTSSAQSSEEAYTVRPTGGNASLTNGDAWLTSIKGVFQRDGYVPEEINLTVTEASNPGHLEVSYIHDTFVANVPDSTTFTLVYSSGWKVDGVSKNPLTDYGIVIEGEPVANDSIYVEYVKEVLGTIIPTNPTAFVSTGWNLYDHTNARAHVVRYSEDAIIKIAGAYSSVKFAPSLSTPAGERISISPVNQVIAIPVGYDEGYFFITGGNSTTTAIWMTWNDWVNGYNWDSATNQQGPFEAYTESTISISSFMTSNFPYGLLCAGTAYDEINFTIQKAYSRVERRAYSTQNVEYAETNDLQYAYDANFIYIERMAAVEYSVPASMTGDYVANDHGLELLNGTSTPALVSTMYGANLRNKLERDVLTISQQTLTDAQKTQVKENLGLNTTVTTVSNQQSGTINANGLTKYSGCSLTLDPGVWVITANCKIGGSVSGKRQGITLTTGNSDGEYNTSCYSLVMKDRTDTANEYYNVSYIPTLASTTTYYLMINNGNVSTAFDARMFAVKIG